MKRGFTLIEIIVVLGILAIVGVILTQILFSTLRGSSKAQVLSAMKQNGQAAVEAMDKTIRGSDNVVAVCSSGAGIILYKSETGTYTRFMHVAATASANGYIYQDNMSTCGASETNSLKLTDTNTKNGVSVLNPSSGSFFSTSVKEGTGTVVTVDFRVEPAIDIRSAYAEVAAIPFKTAIALRGQIRGR